MTRTITGPWTFVRDLAGRRHQPVLVLPGLTATDRSTSALRAHLRALGHPVHGWRLGRNEGPTAEIINGLDARFRELSERYDQPIGLVGWSMGGVFAWALAGRDPELVRSVVTLGSPLRGLPGWVTPPPPSVPVTSIWSRWDSVVPERASMLKEGPGRENIEVRALHLTLGFDPVVTAVVDDRIAQPKQEWARYRPPALVAALLPRPQTRRKRAEA
ncbi:MAG: esterase/lipase family protein [Acidimicrobiales bacterium]